MLLQIWQRLPQEISIERLVLTAPVDHYRGYRQWLLQACEALPVEEVALVDEPTAAALGAGLSPGSKLLVVDMGGSTIDLSIVALEGAKGVQPHWHSCSASEDETWRTVNKACATPGSWAKRGSLLAAAILTTGL